MTTSGSSDEDASKKRGKRTVEPSVAPPIVVRKRKRGSRDPEKLTAKQQRFVDFYTGEAKGNATEAARMAGYKGTDNTLRAVASENLTKPAISKAIEQVNAPIQTKAIATRLELQTFFTAVMRGEEGRSIVMSMSGPVIDEKSGEFVTRPPKVEDRIKAAELLGRMQGAFIERVDVRMADAFRERLETLRRRMKPEAYEELLKALAET